MQWKSIEVRWSTSSKAKGAFAKNPNHIDNPPSLALNSSQIKIKFALKNHFQKESRTIKMRTFN
jgi:hypothetical protein